MNKKQKDAKKLVDKSKKYSLAEALELMPKISTSKFAGTVEVTVNLRLNDKQKKQPIRGSVVFPNSFGEEKKILVLTENAKASEAKKAGADFIGLDDMVKKIEGGWLGFDVVIATPDVMPKIAKLGPHLGRRGLMPNPKNQTVTENIAKAVKMYKSGKKDYKMTEDNSIKTTIGKTDMNIKALTENFEAFKKALSPALKNFRTDAIKAIYIAPTMGPSLRIDLKELIAI